MMATLTCSTPLDKYLTRSPEQHCSWSQFASEDGKVPVERRGTTHATWPLNEDYSRLMLLLHSPNWFKIQEDAKFWIDCFKAFLTTNTCPTFVKAQVSKAKHYAEHP